MQFHAVIHKMAAPVRVGVPEHLTALAKSLTAQIVSK